MRKRKVHSVGYIVVTPGESVSQALLWYQLDSMSMGAKNLKRDVETAFKNTGCRVVDVYETRLVHVGRCLAKKARKG